MWSILGVMAPFPSPAQDVYPLDPSMRVVAVALVDHLQRPTQLLAARRTAPPELAGRWEFPGGKVDPGEVPEEAVKREIREELGIDVRLGAPVTGREATVRDGLPWWTLRPGWVMAVWWAVLTGERAPEPLEDHDELRWLTRGTLNDVPWLDSNTAIVAELHAQLGEPGSRSAGPPSWGNQTSY